MFSKDATARSTTIAAIGAAALLLAACGDDADDTVGDDGSADVGSDDDVETGADDDPGADDETGTEDDAGEDGDAEASGGTVTLNGETVELARAFACEDYDGFGPGEAELWISGQIVTDNDLYGNKFHAGTFHADDGTAEDHVAIYGWDTFDDAPVSGSWSVSEDDDGYPWLDIDGGTVTVDTTHTDDDGDEWVFDAEVEFEVVDGPVRCP